MAKDGRTEKATPKRKQDAREKGQVLKSKEVNNLSNFIALFIGVVFFGTNAVSIFYKVMTIMFEGIRTDEKPMELVKSMAFASAPLLLGTIGLCLIFALVSYYLQVGFLFSPKAAKPDIKKINPANYFKQLVNLKKSGFELLKNLVVFLIIVAVLYNVYLNNAHKFQEFILISWFDSIVQFQTILNELFFKLGLAFLLIGIVDYFFQKYQYEDGLKMKKQDIKDEHKNQNGNPEIRAKQKSLFRKLLQKQVAKTVSDSSVVIVNPTHYAVAIRYKKNQGDKVPRVILKGIDQMALFIKEIARDNNIPIIENKPLARRMHAEVDEGDYIPEDLYLVVGKIIAELVKDKKIKID